MLSIRRIVHFVLLGLGAAAFSSCMPSSIIMQAGREEYDIVNRFSTKTSVEKALGAPVLSEAVDPVASSAFKFPEPASRENYRERSFVHGSEGSPGLRPSGVQMIVSYSRYIAMGKIVPHGYVGDSTAMALMTLGVSELMMIPKAIKQVTPDSTVENTFDVWYSKEGHALAYTWRWSKKIDAAPRPTAQP